jgi:hypothetical protein
VPGAGSRSVELRLICSHSWRWEDSGRDRGEISEVIPFIYFRAGFTFYCLRELIIKNCCKKPFNVISDVRRDHKNCSVKYVC